MRLWFVSILTLVPFLCLADDVVVLKKYRKIKEFRSLKVGVAQPLLGDSILVGQFRDLSLEERRARVQSYFWRFFPLKLQERSLFTSVKACTATAVRYRQQDLTVNGKMLSFKVPESVTPEMERFDFVVFMDIPLMCDDTSSVGPNFWAIYDLASPVRAKPQEECIHFYCRFQILNVREGDMVCYGYFTANDCGLRAERFGENGCWPKSFADFAEELVEDTPFEAKTMDASDFR